VKPADGESQLETSVTYCTGINPVEMSTVKMALNNIQNKMYAASFTLLDEQLQLVVGWSGPQLPRVSAVFTFNPFRYL
jgi:mono/diheme cytochrome c family protein